MDRIYNLTTSATRYLGTLPSLSSVSPVARVSLAAAGALALFVVTYQTIKWAANHIAPSFNSGDFKDLGLNIGETKYSPEKKAKASRKAEPAPAAPASKPQITLLQPLTTQILAQSPNGKAFSTDSGRSFVYRGNDAIPFEIFDKVTLSSEKNQAFCTFGKTRILIEITE